MRRALKWAACAALAVAALAVLCVVVLATGPGQRLALRIAELAISDADTGVAFGRLDGSLFSQGGIDRVVVSDRDGVWLQVREVRFAWSPTKLLVGQIEIDDLRVGNVEVLRQPAAGKSTSGESSGLPLIALVARRFEIAELALDRAGRRHSGTLSRHGERRSRRHAQRSFR